LIPNRIQKVLSSTAAHRVQALLMGGQACVLYGAAEFSLDTDLCILAEPGNLDRLRKALAELQAECIAVPPFRLEHLLRGHAVHFRCQHPEAQDIRIDVMSTLRGVDGFPALWERRTTITDRQGMTYDVMGLPDLVQAKKTQRAKDWPMLTRLLEAHYLAHRESATELQARFWLTELRTPEFLMEVCRNWPNEAHTLADQRPLLQHAATDSMDTLLTALETEEKNERQRDREYWRPLREELEQLRHAKLNKPSE
jgi:hypothetical protein